MVETKYAGLLRSSRKDKTLAYTDNICDPNLSQMQNTLNQLLKQGLQDISNLQSQTKQIKDTVDGIAISGGASIASAVSYDNTTSGLEAMNIQNAIDELVNNLGHYETNEEWIRLYLDAEDHILWGIKADGSIEWSVGIPTPVQNKLNELISSDNTIKQTIAKLREYTDQQLATKVDKEEGKSLIEDEVKECFRVIENEEFIMAVVDSEDKLLFGIYRATGKPYFSLNEMYHVIQNEEYLAVEQDEEGKILSSTNHDGSHYIHNAKSETIPTEFEHIEDPEGRTEITTDAEDKILGYRDSEGTRHEHKISVSHIDLSDEAANEVNEAFKHAGIKMENPSDFSKDRHIELPIPRIAAQVRLYAPKLPTTKHDDIEAVIEYIDKDGNYFRKPVILNAQGSSSMAYYVKNMAIDIADGSEIKFGDFPTQDSFHLKKYYIDAFRGQCVVGYWLMEQVYKSRPIGQQYPYEYSIANDSVSEGFGSPNKDFFTGAKCHPDGFPINITWISNDGTETDMGIYAWNLKKSKEVYYADKKKAENIILDGEIATDTLFGGTIKWSSFEIRNPKSLIDINGNKYDGDNPTELSDTDPNSKKVKDYLISLSKVFSELNTNKTKDVFEKHFLVNPFVDYCLVSDVLYHIDGFRKNWIWLAYNGKQFTPSLYDVDSIFGSHFAGLFTYPNSETTKGLPTWAFPCNILYELYKDDIDARYKVLRDLGIFTVDNIMSLLNKWLDKVGYDNYSKEFSIYNETPSYRKSPLNSEYWKIVNWAGTDTTYDKAKTYIVGEKCIFNLVEFECIKENAGQEPTLFGYSKTPNIMGFYNSPIRVKNWLIKKIETLDIYYNYKK